MSDQRLNSTWRSAWVTAVVFVVAGVVGYAATYAISEKYLMEARLVISPPESDLLGAGALSSQFGGIAALAGLPMGRSGVRDETMATLRSRRLAREVVVSLGLVEELARLKAKEPDQSDSAFRDARIADAAEVLTEQVLSVTEDIKTGLITVGAKHRDPAKAEAIVSNVIAKTDARMRERVVSETAAVIKGVQSAIDDEQQLEVRQMLYRFRESQEKKRALAITRPSYVMAIIDPVSIANGGRPVSPKRALLALAFALLAAGAHFLVSNFRLLYPKSTG